MGGSSRGRDRHTGRRQRRVRAARAGVVAAGLSAKEVLANLQAEDAFPDKEGRQVAIIDSKGNIAAYNGQNAPKWAGDRRGKTGRRREIFWWGHRCGRRWGGRLQLRRANCGSSCALKAADDVVAIRGGTIGIDDRGAERRRTELQNDRYRCLNVDDNPAPIVGLRRLLDMNLGYLLPGEAGRLSARGSRKSSRCGGPSGSVYAVGAGLLGLGISGLQLE